jgi:hypothetical protein
VATKVDKAILTNIGALKAKYKDAGVAKIQKALDALVVSDKSRGLVTTIAALDDAASMRKLSAPRVTDAKDPEQNKKAVDGVFKALAPDYLLLLGATDVIPHQDMQNPMYDPSGEDLDQFAYGDLPYACEASYSQRPQDFLGPTRVVGRLPDLTGGTDPSYLVGLLETAQSYKTFPASQYLDYFGISAEIWQKSTSLSMTHVFGGPANLNTVPPKNDKWPSSELSRMAHFINCHGADTSAQFNGQPAGGARLYPVALDAAYLDGKVPEGTVAAAECCYGGQLYDPSLIGQMGICNVYLGNKAYAFFGSTTIAYGPAASNGQADLICQYFLQSVLRGASLGRAALQARQNFVRAASPPDPSDIKTLAQFNLYGDPSIAPVAIPSSVAEAAPKGLSKAMAFAAAERVEREDRRKALFRFGLNLAMTEPRPRRTKVKPTKSVDTVLRNRARDLGMTPGTILSFDVVHPRALSMALPKQMRVQKATENRFHVVFGFQEKLQTKERGSVVDVTAMIAKEVDGEVVSVSKIVSR